MEERILEVVKSIRPDVDFENETALIDDEILDSFDVYKRQDPDRYRADGRVQYFYRRG